MSMPCQQCGLLHPAGTPCFTLTLPAQGGAAGLQPGTVLAGRYAILRTIHRGGMSVVYLAEDRVQGRQVALKELRLPEEGGADQPGYAEAEAWFARESYLLSTLSHPLIPEFYSVFREGGHSYIAQEYVQGENLQELIARRGPIEERQVAAWGRALCGLLSYLHGSHLGGPLPVVFRDLKPANILVCRSGAELTVVDFGIAKPYRPVPHGASPGTVLGTPGYAAPEQYQGFATPQSDIYALGATLHRLLTGHNPETEDPFRLPPVQALRPDVRAATAALIDRALSLSPNDRFGSALAMREALRAALPATPDLLQAVTAPFYFWTTVLPGVTAPLALVDFNLLRGQLAAAGFPLWSWPALLAGVYLPALLYLYPLFGLYRRGRQVRGPNTLVAVRRARNLLLVRLELALPFWAAVTLAATGGPASLGLALPMLLLLGACLCWAISIWRAGQSPRERGRALLPHPRL